MKRVTTIPGIKTVLMIRTELLSPAVVFKTMANINVYVPNNLHDICIEGVAEVKIVDEYDNNGREVTTTLKFASAEKIETKTKYAFIYIDMIGQAFLIGAKEKPFPVITSEQSTGNPGSSSAVMEYEVKWLSITQPARCYINVVD